jgi:hypothetical protein
VGVVNNSLLLETLGSSQNQLFAQQIAAVSILQRLLDIGTQHSAAMPFSKVKSIYRLPGKRMITPFHFDH